MRGEGINSGFETQARHYQKFQWRYHGPTKRTDISPPKTKKRLCFVYRSCFQPIFVSGTFDLLHTFCNVLC